MGTESGARPVAVVSVSTMSMAFGSILGFLPGFIATALRADLGLDRWQVGLLVSVHYGVTGLGSLPAGRLTDRWGARRAVLTDMALVMLAAALAASLGSYPALLVAAALSGFGYALTIVGTNVAMVRLVAPRWRTVAMVTKNAGLPCLSAVCAAAGPWIAQRWGWEWMFAALGVGAAGVAVSALRVLPDDRPEGRGKVEHPLPEHFGWFPVAAFLMVAGAVPLYNWSVPYVDESLGASSVVSGVLVGVAAAVGAAAMVVVGVLASRAGPEGRTRLVMTLSVDSPLPWVLFGFVRYRVRLAMTLCLALSGFVALVMAGGPFGVWVALVGIVGGISLFTASIGALHAAAVDRAGPAVARATAVTTTGYFLGLTVSPVTFGAFVDSSGSYGWAWFAAAMLLVGAAVAFRLAGRLPPGA
ncbi:MAG: MFS transporter [Acidimicrobiia bacterium]|nr:MFS transporter [Acidimicrobiia bacterium]